MSAVKKAFDIKKPNPVTKVLIGDANKFHKETFKGIVFQFLGNKLYAAEQVSTELVPGDG